MADITHAADIKQKEISQKLAVMQSDRAQAHQSQPLNNILRDVQRTKALQKATEIQHSKLSDRREVAKSQKRAGSSIQSRSKSGGKRNLSASSKKLSSSLLGKNKQEEVDLKRAIRPALLNYIKKGEG